MTPPVDLEEKLRHLPVDARAAFRRFQADGKAADLDVVIFAILEDFIPKKTGPALAGLPGDTPLMDGLGFDSLAITEIIFFAEDLFGISISNEEILKVRTIDELRRFILRKAAAKRAA
ncbi:MAG: acyl carrier protein [Opitutaceae bacterium]